MNSKTLNLKFVDYLAPKLYNLLPTEMKNLSRIKLFSKKCKMYIVKNSDSFMSVLD